jgi:fermentation-respiration switch protein FrsA (DUF1100 family)
VVPDSTCERCCVTATGHSRQPVEHGRALTPLLLNQLQWRLGVSASQLRPVDHLENVECPVFIISGENDRNTRPTDTRMLLERARNPKEVWFVPKAGHVDLHRVARQEYEARVLAFLASMEKTPHGNF